MVSPPWFYHPFDALESATLELSGEEANHILGARRMRIGDQLVLTNGAGQLAHCMLEAANKKTRLIRLIISLVAQIEPPGREIILASALPRGDRLSTMLDMATQLGMTQFQPLEFEHSVSRWSEKTKTRCKRIVVEACKQCKSAWIPKINPIYDYHRVLQGNGHKGENGRRMILMADQFGRSIEAYSSNIEATKKLYLVIGPEGGLSEAETRLAHEHKVPMLRLARPILRIETAAVAAVAAINQTGIIND